MSGRKKIERKIEVDHSGVCFKPCGVKKSVLERTYLLEDEMEAIRLADFEGLYQQECADRMEISRPTFSRLIESARKKIADALLNTKALNIQLKS
jgi:predicted DNA-binding protein (UPF0251 family)